MASGDKVSRVIIRPLPKIVFLYPTWIIATFCAIVASMSDEVPVTTATADAAIISAPEAPAEGDAANAAKTVKLVPLWAGALFIMVFYINMLIFAFDFPRTRSLLLLFAGIAILLILHNMGALGPINDLVGGIHPYANDHFFWSISIFLLVIFLCVAIYTRFNYYEILGNSILHHTGFLGKSKRYPTPNLRRSKEITDVFEYVLLRAGQYVFYPSGERDSIVLDVVFNIEKKERMIQQLMGRIQIAQGAGGVELEESDVM